MKVSTFCTYAIQFDMIVFNAMRCGMMKQMQMDLRFLVESMREIK